VAIKVDCPLVTLLSDLLGCCRHRCFCFAYHLLHVNSGGQASTPQADVATALAASPLTPWLHVWHQIIAEMAG